QDVPVVCLPERVAGRDRDLLGDVLRLPARRALEPVTAGVDKDSVEPGLEARFVAERGALAPGLDVRVVGGVLCLGGAAGDCASEPVRRVDGAAGKARKARAPIVGLRARNAPA